MEGPRQDWFQLVALLKGPPHRLSDTAADMPDSLGNLDKGLRPGTEVECNWYQRNLKDKALRV